MHRDRSGNKKSVELLAPAGSMDSLKAALSFGADAVYMGGPRFGARAFAQNPDSAGLLEALDYVHVRGKKLYLTVNTLLKEEELAGLEAYLLPFYEAGVDAVLVQDLGVLSRIRRDFPDLPVHASTQMTVLDPDGVLALRQMGISRVVTAREITIPEIKSLAQTGVEVEVFVHGAICYCYSGQCLLSSLIGGRSGNRGRCAQPCRLPYDVQENGRILTATGRNYVMNLKDMDTLACLPQLIEAGACSLKIEGRMKSPRYTGGVTAVYRKYLDMALAGGNYSVDPEDRRFLRELFDRGGYTEYASQGLRDRMVSLESKPDFRAVEESFLREKEAAFAKTGSKEKIKGKLRFYTGEPVTITIEPLLPEEALLTGQAAVTVTETGETVQEAKNQPLDEDVLRQRFFRLGDTPFTWDSLEIETDGRGFLPVGQLNLLRRRATDGLIRAILRQHRRQRKEAATNREPQSRQGKQAKTGKRQAEADKKQAAGLPEMYVSADTIPQLRTVLSFPFIRRIYLNLATISEEEEREAFRLLADWKQEEGAESGRSLYLNLPYVVRQETKRRLKERLEVYAEAGADGWLLHTWDQAAWLAKETPRMHRWADASLYTYNRPAAALLAENGISGAALPVELNGGELRERTKASPLPSELIVYGYLPVMVSAQCVRRTVSGCTGRPDLLWLRDRCQKRFAVRNACRFCLNMIYNSEPLYLLDCAEEWKTMDLKALRLQFTIENEKETRRILESCLTESLSVNPLKSFTRGHFRRGVE